jgi:HD-like signal output (HDOD) protein
MTDSHVSDTSKTSPPAEAQSGNLNVNLERMKEAIARAGDLPTLPHIAMEVSRLAHDPVAGMSEIVRIVHDDPSLTAKLLRVANSSFYGMSRHVESLNSALVVLGMRELANIVSCIAIFRAFPKKPGQMSFDRNAFWLHSAGCGEIARAISIRLKLRLNSEGFTAGLVHDIGKIILDQYFHDEFMEALKRSHEQKVSMIEAEDSVLGVNHSELGSWLAEIWSLPKNICDAIAYHHQPETVTGESRQLVALINLADMFCQHAGIGFSGNEVEEVTINNTAWKILSEIQPEIANWDVKAFMLELEDHIERAREFVSIAS